MALMLTVTVIVTMYEAPNLPCGRCLTYLNSFNPHHILQNRYFLILQIRKISPREVKKWTKGHPASRLWG